METKTKVKIKGRIEFVKGVGIYVVIDIPFALYIGLPFLVIVMETYKLDSVVTKKKNNFIRKLNLYVLALCWCLLFYISIANKLIIWFLIGSLIGIFAGPLGVVIGGCFGFLLEYFML